MAEVACAEASERTHTGHDLETSMPLYCGFIEKAQSAAG